MDHVVKEHLSVIIGVTILGLVTGFLALTRIQASVADLNVGSYSALIIIVPCAIMLVCSFIIAATAQTIGRQLFLVVMVICIVAGVLSMVVTNAWMSDPQTAAVLQENSGNGAVLLPVLNAPIVMLRDIAAFVVVPTIGCIAGAWVGSRIHPMRAERSGKKKKRKVRK